MNSIVHLGDCLEAMRLMHDNAFELAIVDPPYGIGEDGGKCRTRNRPGYTKHVSKGWDKEPPSVDYFNELMRVSKNQIVWGANHFISRMPYDSSCWIIWDKMNGTSDFADGEMAWTSFDTAVRFFRRPMQSDNINRIHPTQKSVALYRWLLHNYAKEGDRILDTHMGSQSSRIAAHQMGFDYTGYEIDEDYFKAGCKRYELAIQQQTLFK